MHFSFITSNQQSSRLRQQMTTSMFFFVACVATALGQEVNTASTDLFSPPSFGGSGPGTGAFSDGPLPFTQEFVPSMGQSPVFGQAAPEADLSSALPASQPAAVATPALLSTPGIVNGAPMTTMPASPVAPTASANVDWGATHTYEHAKSLWGDAGTTPPQSAIPYPTVAYPAESHSYVPGQIVTAEPIVGNIGGYEQPCYGPSVEAPVQFEAVDGATQNCGGGGGCGNRTCGSLCGCGPCTWARFDVLLWNINGYATPALITRAPGNVVQNGAGALDGDDTQVLFGNQDLGDDLRVGGRLQYGMWFDKCRRFGIQTDFFGLGGNNQSTTFTGNGNDIFARPFFNTNPNVNAQDAQVFAMPGLAEGSVRFDRSSEVWSAGPALRFNLCCNDGCDPCCRPRSTRVDFLLGYRFFRLEERFASQEILRPTDPAYVDGTSFELNDSIGTRNDFHGVEFGVNRLTQRGPWLWDVTALVALGEVERVVDLNGSTRINVPGFSDNTFPGGFFVGPGDIGRFRDSDFAAIPQIRLNMSYCLGCNWRVSAGYNFMYLSSAFRPGQFLNTQFDGARLGQEVAVDSVRRPSFQRDSLFLHGANVGLTYNF